MACRGAGKAPRLAEIRATGGVVPTDGRRAQTKNRADHDEQLSRSITDIGVRQFLLKNIDRTKTGFRWKMNLEGIISNYEEIQKEITASWPLNVPALFIRGGTSNYITDSDFEQVKDMFPLAELETVPKAGHWVHAEQPGTFLQKLMPFLEG